MNVDFDTLTTQANSFRDLITSAAQQVRDFTQRMELILSQDHKNIPIRDTSFAEQFGQFCTQLRAQLDQQLDQWHTLRSELRQIFPKAERPSSLEAKSFSLRAKDLSRACDDFTTAYDQYNKFYKKYTLSKLPVWMLTSCCDDLNNVIGKILFLSREINKKAEIPQGRTHVHG